MCECDNQYYTNINIILNGVFVQHQSCVDFELKLVLGRILWSTLEGPGGHLHESIISEPHFMMEFVVNMIDWQGEITQK